MTARNREDGSNRGVTGRPDEAHGPSRRDAHNFAQQAPGDGTTKGPRRGIAAITPRQESK